MKNLINLTILYYLFSCCNDKKTDEVGLITDTDKVYIDYYSNKSTISFENSDKKIITFDVTISNTTENEKNKYIDIPCNGTYINSKSIYVSLKSSFLTVFLNITKYRKGNPSGTIHDFVASLLDKPYIFWDNKILLKNDTIINGFNAKVNSYYCYGYLDRSSDSSYTYLIVEPYKGLTMLRLKNDTSIYYLKP